MNIEMGNQTFRNVAIPLLWGTRAILQDKKGRLSVLNLAGPVALTEIVGDEPAPGIRFVPKLEGFAILGANKHELYVYIPEKKRLTESSEDLPECEVRSDEILVGSNRFAGNMVSGSGVGISITQNGIAMGSPLPAGLAKLVVS
jgi:hypothetical protein